MYTLKQGVTIFMSPEIETILSVVQPVYKSFALPVVITSGLDGPHRNGSKHYRFRAIDLRKKFIDPLDSETWIVHGSRIIDMMETIFRVKNLPVRIVNEEDHLHVEWNGT